MILERQIENILRAINMGQNQTLGTLHFSVILVDINPRFSSDAIQPSSFDFHEP